jgi:hypothetical protein
VPHAERSVVDTTRKSFRYRIQAVTVGAALAFMAGLAGAGIASNDTTETTPVAIDVAPNTVENNDPKNDAAAAQAPAPAKPAAADKASRSKASAAAKAPAAKPKAPSDKQLHPTGIPGGQESFTPTKEQLQNAKAIVDTGKKLGLPPRAWVIAVATATQESTLRNLGHLGAGNDHDSQGLFQQRPSSGWGSPEQITNPEYSSTAFYKALKNLDGYDKMPLTDAAQTVQVSAYPDHYAKWEQVAGDIVKGLHGAGPYAKAAANLK